MYVYNFGYKFYCFLAISCLMFQNEEDDNKPGDLPHFPSNKLQQLAVDNVSSKVSHNNA